MPTFCRHNRFLERCPICSKTLPRETPGGASKAPASKARRTGSSATGTRRARTRGETVRVRREGRAEEDGYRSELVPGVRASADAARLAEEIAFSAGRLLALGADPPELYGEVRALAASDLERATWAAFLIAYLSPLAGEDPFAGIRAALERAPRLEDLEQLQDLDGLPLGPRSSHDPARGADTLIAYRQWVARGGGPGGRSSGPQEDARGSTQESAFRGDPGWSAERRFERLFERLALPGFGRTGRYELLVTLGRLGCYELRPDSLRLSGAGAASGSEATTLAAKRVFGIGDALLLERRAAALAQAVSVPIETLDLALANWASSPRATQGFPAQAAEQGARERALAALGL